MNKWDKYFIDICDVVAKLSKDESTQLGCVIVGPYKEIRSTGYNSFPRGINDNIKERQVRPLKYKYFEHAEANAIHNAARVGTPLDGCTIYVPWIPCSTCARAIIQCGIKEVVVRNMKVEERWEEDMLASKQMFDEADIKIRSIE